jgi:uncharacterized protein DUF4397
LTPAGDDSTILFTSAPVTLNAQAQFLISIFDGDRNDTASIVGHLINQTTGSSLQLADSRFPPTIRFIHASMSMGNADIYVDDPLTTPIVADHAFTDITGFYEITTGLVPITYTTPGDTGTLLIDTDVALVQGTRREFYVIQGPDGNDFSIDNVADRRAVDTRSRLELINAAAGRDAIDFYLVPSGELIDEATPFVAGLPLALGPFPFPIAPASYDIYITDVDEKVPLAGPIPFAPDFGDFFQAIIFENVQPTVVDFAFIPQP